MHRVWNGRVKYFRCRSTETASQAAPMCVFYNNQFAESVDRSYPTILYMCLCLMYARACVLFWIFLSFFLSSSSLSLSSFVINSTHFQLIVRDRRHFQFVSSLMVWYSKIKNPLRKQHREREARDPYIFLFTLSIWKNLHKNILAFGFCLFAVWRFDESIDVEK